MSEKTGGVFLDIGANHPCFNNNTAFFEKERDYSGWAFDPLNKYIGLWAEARPRTTFVQCALGEAPGRIAFHETSGEEGWEDQLSYVEVIDEADMEAAARAKSTDVSIVEVKPLREFEVGEIDFASIDVEGFEEMVLKGMFPEIRPKVILVENCSFPVGSERLRKMILSEGYRFHSRVRYIDDLYVREN
ncbi:FkbM family methyltransferase [Erythrobacter sp. GH1-10]|uniref:FkbM family methyltransferase n=1 Tax=Erythrobacter sp. GH1-10 TaxID=3349334 RepID=UPI00387829E9